MAGLNKISLIGNLGRDPEMRYIPSGTAVCNLRLGVTERRKDGDSWQDHTEWFTVICFGKTAENAAKFLKKGRQIFAEGRLQTRSWEDKEGQPRQTVEVVANQLLFLGSGGKENTSEYGYPPMGGTSASSSSLGASGLGQGLPSQTSEMEDEDLPF